VQHREQESQQAEALAVSTVVAEGGLLQVTLAVLAVLADIQALGAMQIRAPVLAHLALLGQAALAAEEEAAGPATAAAAAGASVFLGSELMAGTGQGQAAMPQRLACKLVVVLAEKCPLSPTPTLKQRWPVVITAAAAAGLTTPLPLLVLQLTGQYASSGRGLQDHSLTYQVNNHVCSHRKQHRCRISCRGA
jgi:hypothetical protein